jgi:hypothetical protein
MILDTINPVVYFVIPAIEKRRAESSESIGITGFPPSRE